VRATKYRSTFCCLTALRSCAQRQFACACACRWEHLIDDATEELSRLDEAVAAKQQQLLNVEHDIVDVQSHLDSLVQDKDRAHAAAMDSTMQLAAYERDLSVVCEEAKQLEAQLSGLRQECVRLAACKVKLETTISGMDDSSKFSQVRRDKVRSELAQVEDALRSAHLAAVRRAQLAWVTCVTIDP
jgi:chromosome segregation ATPase